MVVLVTATEVRPQQKWFCLPSQVFTCHLLSNWTYTSDKNEGGVWRYWLSMPLVLSEWKQNKGVDGWVVWGLLVFNSASFCNSEYKAYLSSVQTINAFSFCWKKSVQVPGHLTLEIFWSHPTGEIAHISSGLGTLWSPPGGTGGSCGLNTLLRPLPSIPNFNFFLF